jgi:tetratricopeptide (TPR) repeat protein
MSDIKEIQKKQSLTKDKFAGLIKIIAPSIITSITTLIITSITTLIIFLNTRLVEILSNTLSLNIWAAKILIFTLIGYICLIVIITLYDLFFNKLKYKKILFIIITLCFFLIQGSVYFIDQHIQKTPPTKIIFLIANFDESNRKVDRTTENIKTKLKSSLSTYSDVQVLPLDEIITQDQGSTYARKKGKENKATVVIWGWYANQGAKGEQAEVNFEILDNPFVPQKIAYQVLKPEARGEETIESQKNSFTVRTKIKHNITALSLFVLGLAHLYENDWNKAIHLFNQTLTEGKEDNQLLQLDVVYFYNGYANYKAGYNQQSIENYNNAILVNPKDAAAYNNKGIALRGLGKHEEAIAAYDQTIKIDPKDAAAYNNKGNVLVYLGKYEEAIVAYDQAIKIDPKDAAAYNKKGILLRGLKKYEEAIAAHDQAIKIDPKNADAYRLKWFVLYYHLGKYEEAEEASDKAKEIESKSK